ncbi:hypothetical protein CKO_04232 [Citrobacter koseri ATCC BAA-895]|uniref:Uncharacterized protein n=1 Tax=Citrobacter koseri (strain ATCC BAA-895 / CDC 4225-83 / SGSC4696) TaxID=290338 RepID=A8AP79_CITK8|nr:hypothetical protein CKO_04232 [Citrobacter koseri ATCC BAA-895]
MQFCAFATSAQALRIYCGKIVLSHAQHQHNSAQKTRFMRTKRTISTGNLNTIASIVDLNQMGFIGN